MGPVLKGEDETRRWCRGRLLRCRAMRPAYPAENRCCVALIRHTALDEDLRRWLIELGFILLTGVSCGYDPPVCKFLFLRFLA